MIEFRDVSLSFDEKPALSDVSFALDRGRIIIVTGTSGSGKTVLLHLAAGLLRADEGQVIVEGRDLASLDERELLEFRSRSIGLVFQEDTLFTGLTLFENTAYRLVEHAWNEADIERAVDEILRFVGLADHKEKLPEELSIGMRRRLELARALVGWPPLMLFDEPTSGLDPINARQVLDLIIRARDLHQISGLYVTKELHEIDYLTTHRLLADEASVSAVVKIDPDPRNDMEVILLEEGRVAFKGYSRLFKESELPAVRRMTGTR